MPTIKAITAKIFVLSFTIAHHYSIINGRMDIKYLLTYTSLPNPVARNGGAIAYFDQVVNTIDNRCYTILPS